MKGRVPRPLSRQAARADGEPAPLPPHDANDAASRRRFMAYAGLLLSGLALIATVWETLPILTAVDDLKPTFPYLTDLKGLGCRHERSMVRAPTRLSRPAVAKAKAATTARTGSRAMPLDDDHGDNGSSIETTLRAQFKKANAPRARI